MYLYILLSVTNAFSFYLMSEILRYDDGLFFLFSAAMELKSLGTKDRYVPAVGLYWCC